MHHGGFFFFFYFFPGVNANWADGQEFNCLFSFFLLDVCGVTLHQTSPLLGGGWCISSYFQQQMIPGCSAFTKEFTELKCVWRNWSS